jgi:hypothetical protein
MGESRTSCCFVKVMYAVGSSSHRQAKCCFQVLGPCFQAILKGRGAAMECCGPQATSTAQLRVSAPCNKHQRSIITTPGPYVEEHDAKSHLSGSQPMCHNLGVVRAARRCGRHRLKRFHRYVFNEGTVSVSALFTWLHSEYT